jgi:hypothetical protein
METTTLTCKCFVERNGYWTGRRCKFKAKFIVTTSDGPKPMCGIHKNRMVRRGWHNSVVVVPLDEAKP